MQITWFCERDIKARPKRKRKRTHFSLIDVSALTFLVSTAYLSAPQVAEKLPSLFDADCRPSERDPIFQMSRRQKNLWIRIEVVSRSRPTDRRRRRDNLSPAAPVALYLYDCILSERNNFGCHRRRRRHRRISVLPKRNEQSPDQEKFCRRSRHVCSKSAS